MEKEFLDVFRNLELNGELKALLKEVVVTKVSVNQKKDHIRVYIRSRQWIHKKYIYALEEAIASQCFRGVPMTVKVLEKFQLSSQYTPELFLMHTNRPWVWSLEITAFWYLICSGML